MLSFINVMLNELKYKIETGNKKALARAITLVENNNNNSFEILQSFQQKQIPLIGITGPPGAGKSTLTDALIENFIQQKKKVGVLCVDPSSPFTSGALLGDRIRMQSWYNHPDVFIRSLASRGNPGGVNPNIIEIITLMQAADFDYIIIETVGAGQNEVEIAGIANVTVVVLIPEYGDEIQSLKSGLMEIADIFAVNKSDKPNASKFANSLRRTIASFNIKKDVPVVETVASTKQGVDILAKEILLQLHNENSDKQSWLLAQKAFYLIRGKRMQNISVHQLKNEIVQLLQQTDFNLYMFIKTHL
ncbi:MAG: methylmalonyl Co-A mutase-associated GTPase MeaB [Parafilimonas sp.]